MRFFFYTCKKMYTLDTHNYHTIYDTEQTPHIYTDIQKDTSGTFPRFGYPTCTRGWSIVMRGCSEGKSVLIKTDVHPYHNNQFQVTGPKTNGRY